METAALFGFLACIQDFARKKQTVPRRLSQGPVAHRLYRARAAALPTRQAVAIRRGSPDVMSERRSRPGAAEARGAVETAPAATGPPATAARRRLRYQPGPRARLASGAQARPRTRVRRPCRRM